ncbi:GAF domain-containing protein [Desulfocurvus sp.]|jgi:hypothetical protein|uniref:GAF domain-containing protein n=1 Tax=Desulfocurvus sp. TaxID=2871698 RepID=UPI0025C07368|nr:GAF domain-containing protein [Desulfocurvus sp.]MCK9239625.1 GAF domain-containing protein [Desulfocurvus sp.]
MGTDSLIKFLNVVGSVYDAYSAVLFLPAVTGEGFCIAGKFSLGDGIDGATTIMPGQGLVGWILRNKKPLLINNFDQKRSHLGYYDHKDESQIKAFMGCPVQGGGALCVDSRRQYSFSDKDQKILDLLARLACDIQSSEFLIGQGMEESRFYRTLQHMVELRARAPRWAAYLTTFLELLAQATGFGQCFLAARDERGANYFLEGVPEGFFPSHVPHPGMVPIKSGLVGYVFNSGQPVFSGDRGCCPAGRSLFGKDVPAPELGSFVLLPVVFGRKPRAVLALCSPEVVAVTPAMRNFLGLATANLSLFLENLYLQARLASLGPSS